MTSASQLAGQRVLVTGARGFIGSHLCRQLLEAGAEVHGVSRSEQASSERNLHWWKSDLSDISAVRSLFQNLRPDIIYHLASLVTGARDLQVVEPIFHANLASSVNLLVLASEIGCHRLVLAGSQEEPEDARDIPCSPYAAAKSAVHGYAQMFHALYGTPVVTARVFMTYGPAQMDLQKLIPYVTLALLRGESPRLSSGERLVDWIFIEDLACALLILAQMQGIEGSTIDLGSGSLVSIRAVVEKLARFTGSAAPPQFGALPDRPMEQVRTADSATTLEKMGWQATTSLDAGLERTVEWYRSSLGRLFTPRDVSLTRPRSEEIAAPRDLA